MDGKKSPSLPPPRPPNPNTGEETWTRSQLRNWRRQVGKGYSGKSANKGDGKGDKDSKGGKADKNSKGGKGDKNTKGTKGGKDTMGGKGGKAICWDWQQYGSCSRGAQCRFQHV